MGQLVQQTLADLRDAAALETNSNDAIWFAGDLLHRFHSDFRWPSAFDFIDAETVTPEEAAALQQGILQALDTGPSLAVKAGLLSALRHARDPQLKPLFVDYTKEALAAIEGGHSVLNGCLDALHDLGENLETEKQLSAFPRWEENWQTARDYIMRTHPDVVFPIPFGRSVPKDD